MVEEPAAVQASRGGWWLFYSGDSYDQPGYSIGLAWCRSLTEPCTETSDHPLLSTVGDQRSPGGLEFYTRPDGSPAVRATAIGAGLNPDEHSGITSDGSDVVLTT